MVGHFTLDQMVMGSVPGQVAITTTNLFSATYKREQ